MNSAYDLFCTKSLNIKPLFFHPITPYQFLYQDAQDSSKKPRICTLGGAWVKCLWLAPVLDASFLQCMKDTDTPNPIRSLEGSENSYHREIPRSNWYARSRKSRFCSFYIEESCWFIGSFLPTPASSYFRCSCIIEHADVVSIWKWLEEQARFGGKLIFEKLAL